MGEEQIHCVNMQIILTSKDKSFAPGELQSGAKLFYGGKK
jgi:hypothetical protein